MRLLLVIGVFFSLSSWGCTFPIPGPFFKSDSKGYVKNIFPSSTDETARVLGNQVAEVRTHGCEENWGYTFYLRIWKEKSPLDPEQAIHWFKKTIMPLMIPEKAKEYDVEAKWDKMIKYLYNAKEKKTKFQRSMTYCFQKTKKIKGSTSCAATMTYEVNNLQGAQVYSFSYLDKETTSVTDATTK